MNEGTEKPKPLRKDWRVRGLILTAAVVGFLIGMVFFGASRQRAGALRRHRRATPRSDSRVADTEHVNTNAGSAGADPMTRAHAREDTGRRRKLRKGRDQCTAHCRDGAQCMAPTVEGALVCRKHGGASPQVQIAAKHFLLLMAHYTAVREYKEAGGTPGEFDALCRWSAAERELAVYEAKLLQLAELRAAVKELKAAAGAEARGT